MKVIVVIPARGGSKGVPRKNVRIVGGKPLIAWSIEAAQASKLVTRVIVSTDDAEITEVALDHGAGRLGPVEVHQRPAWAATDDAPIEAALWSIHQRIGEPYDYMVTLQPTVPVRAPGLVDEMVKKAVELECSALFSAQILAACWLWRETTGAPFLEECAFERLGRPMQRQQAARRDLVWYHDGSVCVSAGPIRQQDRMAGRAFPYVVPRTVDIDTEADLELAELLLARAHAAA